MYEALICSLHLFSFLLQSPSVAPSVAPPVAPPLQYEVLAVVMLWVQVLVQERSFSCMVVVALN